MKRTKKSKQVPQLAQARQRFDRWRASCGSGRRRIPEALWRVAVKLAARHGLHLTASSLGVNYMALKAQAVKSGVLPPTPKPQFVEVMPVGVLSGGGSLIELEKPGGVKLRVQLKAGEDMDIAALLRSFWGLGA